LLILGHRQKSILKNLVFSNQISFAYPVNDIRTSDGSGRKFGKTSKTLADPRLRGLPVITVGPGVTAPGVVGPGVTGTVVVGSGVTGVGLVGPGVTGAGLVGPGVTGAGLVGPGVTGAGLDGLCVTGEVGGAPPVHVG
jgi:hypothetical protein